MPSQTPVESIQTKEPVVALTFDDGPHVTITAQMLELFARENIKVTFFEIGKNVLQFPELAKAVVAAGHEIGNHSRNHVNLGEMTEVDAVRAEIVETQEIIRETTGFTPVVFRAPFLSHGPALWPVLEELNLPSINGIAAADWDASTTKESIVETYSNMNAGEIILLHT
ncbi:MAG TPA: polysaccharide deacetylase family protein, partial [Chthoniobacterales bacterium]